jgi:hypothetical protein
VGSGPFVEQRFDEAFGFAVCLWAADAGVAGSQSASYELVVPGALEAFAVVGQDFVELDPVAAVDGAAAVEEVERVGGCLARVELGVGEPCAVVDANEEVVPAGAAAAAVGQTCLRVAGSFDPAELFDVDVDQLTGLAAFVADHRLSELRVKA